MSKQLYEFIPITEAIIKGLENGRYYNLKNGTLHGLSVLGLDIKGQTLENALDFEILLPYTSTEAVSDEEILLYSEKALDNLTQRLVFQAAAMWMRSQLIGKEAIDKSFIIQKMNELVNTLLKNPYENELLKKQIEKGKDNYTITDYINDWAEENLKEVDSKSDEN